MRKERKSFIDGRPFLESRKTFLCLAYYFCICMTWRFDSYTVRGGNLDGNGMEGKWVLETGMEFALRLVSSMDRLEFISSTFFTLLT
jgi:hypothetical protein